MKNNKTINLNKHKNRRIKDKEKMNKEIKNKLNIHNQENKLNIHNQENKLNIHNQENKFCIINYLERILKICFLNDFIHTQEYSIF